MTWPFENDTSAITKKLAQRSFKANKLRNIVAVIAIVLTSMLFTSVTTLCVGAIQSIQTTILQIRGTSPSTGTSVNWIAIMVAPDKKTLKKSVKSMFFMVQTRCEVETIKY